MLEAPWKLFAEEKQDLRARMKKYAERRPAVFLSNCRVLTLIGSQKAAVCHEEETGNVIGP